MCAAAAVSIAALQCLAERLGRLLGAILSKRSARNTAPGLWFRRWTSAALFTLLAAGSLSRLATLGLGFSGPPRVFLALPPSSDPTIVCAGAEWYRYPSAFWLPGPTYRLQFVASGFTGLLPRPFDPREVGLLERLCAWGWSKRHDQDEVHDCLEPVTANFMLERHLLASQGGTASAPVELNDRNEASKGTFWPNATGCDYFVTQRVGAGEYVDGSEYLGERLLGSLLWVTYQGIDVDFLHISSTMTRPSLTRDLALWPPHLRSQAQPRIGSKRLRCHSWTLPPHPPSLGRSTYPICLPARIDIPRTSSCNGGHRPQSREDGLSCASLKHVLVATRKGES